MKNWKLGVIAVMSLLLAAVLSGCAFNASPEDLYTLPSLPNEYTELRTMINEILEGGAEYAAPVSGTNIQPVQLIDLDGDGVEEAVAFFRNSADEKSLKIYIFRSENGTYVQDAVIEGSGASINSIRYVDMDGDRSQEIIVGWRVSTEILAMSVYSARGRNMTPLMYTIYSRYEVLDFDDDGTEEIVILRSDTTGNPVAEYYDWEGNLLESKSITRLSMTMAELQRVDVGALRGGETALFVTGVAEETKAITDILMYKQDSIVNIVRNDATGVSSEIFRYTDLHPMDIDGDGVTEVPMPTILPSSLEDSSETYWQVYWRSYDNNGQSETVLSTYHNLTDGWYLVLPEEWTDQIAVRQINGSEERAVIFSARQSDGSYKDAVGIYTLTGNNREYRATMNGRFAMKRQVSVTYAGAFFEGNDNWQYALTQDELNERFRLVVKEWVPGNS